MSASPERIRLEDDGMYIARRVECGLAAEGRTVLVSSHILAEVAQTADSVVILDHGRLVAQSTLAELTAGAALEKVFFQLTAKTTGEVSR